jgi:hypothetical protein
MGYLIFQNGKFIGIKPRAPSHPFTFKCPAATGRTETKTHYCGQICQLSASPATGKFQYLTQR